MITQKIQETLNAQIQAELNSAYMYLAMSAYCESRTFKGFGHWLRVQFQEETGHAEKFINHLLARGGHVVFRRIEAPPSEFGTMLQVFEHVLAHEREVTQFVHGLHDVALTEKDVATQVFLQWFITEQVEEEASVAEMVEKLRMVGDKGGALLYLDKEASKREKG